MRTALLIMVHGSPKMSANDPVFRVADAIRARGVYPFVKIGFLECNEPSIPDAIAECVSRGVERIDAVPYFLHTGRHVADDIPALLELAKERYPHVQVRLGDFLGRSPLVSALLAKRAESA